MTTLSLHGDNFRPVDAKTAAWALAQHFAARALPLDSAGPKLSAADIKGPTLSLRDRLPRVVRQIIDTELALQDVTWEQFAASTGNFGSRHVKRAVHAVYYAIRTQTTWGGQPPTESQIAHWLGRHPSSVHHGLAAERARREAVSA